MAQKFDLLVAGTGIAALVAAANAAKRGLSVGWMAPGTSSANVPGVGFISAASANEVGKDFAGTCDALTPVVSHNLVLYGSGSGTALNFRDESRITKPTAYVYDRAKLLASLAQRCGAAGVKALDADQVDEFMYDEASQLRGVRLKSGAIVRCRSLVIGEGGERVIRNQLSEAVNPGERKVGRAWATVTLAPEKLAERCGLETGQAAFGRVVGNFAGGLPAAGWMATTPTGLVFGVSLVTDPFHESPDGAAAEALKRVLDSPAVKPLVRGAAVSSLSQQAAQISGYKYLAPLYGNGWVLVGLPTRMTDPLRQETAANDISAALIAVDAAKRAIAADDTSARSLGVYRAMLDESAVMADLKAQRNAVEEIERDPSLLAWYPDFFNRMLANDTSAGSGPRRQRNREFFRSIRNERPIWEFAMGMRRGLRLLRD